MILNYYPLRDRNFTSDTEIAKIKAKYPHHTILQYYNFENYLYHPDNFEVLNLQDFDKEAYVAEIKNRNEQKLHISLTTIVSFRQSYEDFKTDSKLRDKDVNSIVNEFTTVDFGDLQVLQYEGTLY